MTYWLRQRPPDAHDLDGVGLKLVGDGYAVAAVAARHGGRLVEGVDPGDRLTSVDGTSLGGLPPDRAITALAGRPGERPSLRLSRSGQPLEIGAAVSPF